MTSQHDLVLVEISEKIDEIEQLVNSLPMRSVQREFISTLLQCLFDDIASSAAVEETL